MNFVISVLILVAPSVMGIWIAYRLWKYGILGRICLIGMFMCAAVEAHSIIYPKKQLKENYARVIA